jgi:cellulose synthase/poly-beta-1,6-N-acetylglucosamine synthase-like glycosyltransferase
MNFIYGIYLALSAWIVLQLVLPFLTVLASRIFGRERVSTTPPEPAVDYACIITAYKNGLIARPLVQSLLNQTHENLTIYLVADECPEEDYGFSDKRFVLLRPESPLRLKVKSIRYAVDRFVRPHQYVVVFDADNLAHPQFLEFLDPYISAGYRCIQGRRTAKNLDSNYAAADSLGETYKNYIERYAPWLLGGSAVISGSGMATETALFMDYLNSPDIQKGQNLGKKMLQEDKILQNFLLNRDEHIAYAWNAVCYDEKADNGQAVETQRSRWLFSYFQNIPNALGILIKGLRRASMNQFFFGLLTLSLPMFIQLGIAFVLAVAGLLLSPVVSLCLVVAVGIFACTVLWTLRLSDSPGIVWNAVWAVPRFIARQVLGLFKMTDPNKNFQHSEHKKMVSVEDILKKP